MEVHAHLHSRNPPNVGGEYGSILLRRIFGCLWLCPKSTFDTPGTALPPDVRRGCAAGCEARLCRAVQLRIGRRAAPAVRACPHFHWPKAEPRAKPYALWKL
jgi:hypothetical protein